MKLSISNIALPAYDHGRELAQLTGLELSGLEVAPSRVWRDTWKNLRPEDVERYRRTVASSGLEVVGLHSLFYDHPELGIFRGPSTRRETIKFMVHLSKICRDLGGKTLIYGGGRNRGTLSVDEADEQALQLFSELIPLIEDHGTCFCFEPLGQQDSDYINSARASIRLVNALDSPCLRVQLDAKALVENEEVELEMFEAAAPYLVHFHANEPGLGVLGETERVDHRALGALLKGINYSKFVSIEQRMIGENSPMNAVAKSVDVLKNCYAQA